MLPLLAFRSRSRYEVNDIMTKRIGEGSVARIKNLFIGILVLVTDESRKLHIPFSQRIEFPVIWQ